MNKFFIYTTLMDVICGIFLDILCSIMSTGICDKMCECLCHEDEATKPILDKQVF